MTTRSETKQQTRDALVRAARELIATQGYRETTIEQIAERAGVSPRTFFRHFPTKEAALFSRVDDIVALLERTLAAVPEGTPVVTALHGALHAVARTLQEEGGWMVRVAAMAEDIPEIGAHLELQVSDRLHKVVVDWAERHLGVPAVADPRPRLAAGILVTCAGTARTRWLAYGGRTDLPALVDESLTALAGLLAEVDLDPGQHSRPGTRA